MNIYFTTNKIRKLCSSFKKLCNQYWEDAAWNIMRRIDELDAVPNLYDIRIFPFYWLHTLKWDRKFQMAIYVKKWDKTMPYRIVFQSLNWKDVYNDFKNINKFKTITEIEIIEITNYHK